MLKKIAVLAAFFTFPFFSLQTVRALEVEVLGGVISVYDNTILGERDAVDTIKQVEDSNRKKILTRQAQSIRVDKVGERTEIELRPTPTRATERDESPRSKLERVEQLETDRLEMRFEPDSKLTTRDTKQEHRLMLESRRVEAHLPEGAQFELSSETNQVSLITPSGEQRMLNHLPDQAIERMVASGLFTAGDQIDTTMVEVNSDTQEIEYRQKVRVTKRLFGLFRRGVETEVILNDTTGEVRADSQTTGFAKFLDSLSI
ncbi:MAG: hypothetical protein GW946_02845 [Candidatus Pacebacteria bacterium]|nr:hypothetical protein [Candidatus Paceibacterota bacterium]PIR59889.1 MAG: hypothetical protein COU67_04485 [Candidatus Pacebacteria bacterium CG10_big_fil_rev_8_21_14_0_10_44_54]